MSYELIHYGIPNMKWGVRRFQNKDGSLTPEGKERYAVGTGGNTKFDEKFREDLKKFKKLSDKANTDIQTKKLEEGRSIAKTGLKVGIPAALAAASLVGLDEHAKSKHLDDSFYLFKRGVGTSNNADRLKNIAEGARKAGITDKDVLQQLDKVVDFAKRENMEVQAEQMVLDRNFKSGQLGRAVGASITGIVAVGALGAAAYGGVSAAVAKHRLSDKGHAKAVARRDAQYNKISNMVKDTPYMALFEAQIEAYKKEHPNTELSDKQIMKNLM